MKVPYSMNVDGNLTMRGTSATITSAGAATFQSVSAYTYLGLNLSTGVEDFVAPTAIYNTDGSISISAAKINMYDNATYQGAIVTYQVAGATLTLTDGLQQYIVADYNSGNPIYRIESNKANINSSNIIGIRVVWRQGTNVHSTDFDSAGINLANKIDRSILETTPYRISRDGGLVLSETSSPAVRTILITSAVVYGGTVPHLVSAYNSSTDTFTLVNHVAGVWNYTSGTIQYNNTQYDDGTNLQTIPNNKYSIRWIYRTIGTSKEVFQVLGTSYYNSIELARLEKERSDLPDLVKGHGFLVGRIIVQYNAASGIVENVTTTTFGTAQVQNHNDLNNIQGGDATGYYHLTSAQNNYISNVSADIQTQLNNRLPLSGGVLTGNISGTYATFSGNLTANFLYGKSQYINIAQNSVAAADYSIPYIGTPSTGDIFYSSANGITLNPSTGEFKVKTIIENGQTLSSRYLPISGGPMYGAITMSTSETISSTELTKTGFSFGGYHGITKFTGGNAATIPGGVGATDGPFIYGYGGVALGFIQGNTSAYSLSAALKTNGLNVFIAGLLTAPTISTTAITATGSITINANYPLRFTYGGVSNYYLATDTNGIYLAIFSSANAGKSIFLETYDTDIFHRKNGTNYAILDKSNYITTIGTASSTTSGALTSSDWSLFNSKLDPATASSIYLPLSGGTLTGNISAGSNSIYFGNASLHKSGDSNWIHVGTSGFLPDTNLVQSLGNAAYQFATIYGGTIYEGSSALSSKYLGITAASTTYLGINAAAASSNFLNKNSAFKSSGEAGVQYYDADFTPIGTSANYNGFQGPTTAWYQVIHMPLSVGNYFNELLFPVNDTAGLWWRQRRNASYYGWFKILDSQNFMSYALPLTGGTLTGPVSGTSISATNFYGNFNGPIASAPYLPLSGGTLTGGLIGTTATFGNAGIASTTGQTAAWFGYNGLNNGTSTPYGFNQWSDGGLVIGIPNSRTAFFHVAGTSILSMSLGNVYVTGQLSATTNVIAGNAAIAQYTNPSATTFAWFGKVGTNPSNGNLAGMITNGTDTYIGASTAGTVNLSVSGTTIAYISNGGLTVNGGSAASSVANFAGKVIVGQGYLDGQQSLFIGNDASLGDCNNGGVLRITHSDGTSNIGAFRYGTGSVQAGFNGTNFYINTNTDIGNLHLGTYNGSPTAYSGIWHTSVTKNDYNFAFLTQNDGSQTYLNASASIELQIGNGTTTRNTRLRISNTAINATTDFYIGGNYIRSGSGGDATIWNDNANFYFGSAGVSRGMYFQDGSVSVLQWTAGGNPTFNRTVKINGDLILNGAMRGISRPGDGGVTVFANSTGNRNGFSNGTYTIPLNHYEYSGFTGFLGGQGTTAAPWEFYGITQDHKIDGGGAELSIIAGAPGGHISFFAGASTLLTANNNYQAPLVGNWTNSGLTVYGNLTATNYSGKYNGMNNNQYVYGSSVYGSFTDAPSYSPDSNQRCGFFQTTASTPNGDWFHYINNRGGSWGDGSQFTFQIGANFGNKNYGTPAAWGGEQYWIRTISNGTLGTWRTLATLQMDNVWTGTNGFPSLSASYAWHAGINMYGSGTSPTLGIIWTNRDVQLNSIVTGTLRIYQPSSTNYGKLGMGYSAYNYIESDTNSVFNIIASTNNMNINCMGALSLSAASGSITMNTPSSISINATNAFNLTATYTTFFGSVTATNSLYSPTLTGNVVGAGTLNATTTNTGTLTAAALTGTNIVATTLNTGSLTATGQIYNGLANINMIFNTVGSYFMGFGVNSGFVNAGGSRQNLHIGSVQNLNSTTWQIGSSATTSTTNYMTLSVGGGIRVATLTLTANMTATESMQGSYVCLGGSYTLTLPVTGMPQNMWFIVRGGGSLSSPSTFYIRGTPQSGSVSFSGSCGIATFDGSVWIVG